MKCDAMASLGHSLRTPVALSWRICLLAQRSGRQTVNFAPDVSASRACSNANRAPHAESSLEPT